MDNQTHDPIQTPVQQPITPQSNISSVSTTEVNRKPVILLMAGLVIILFVAGTIYLLNVKKWQTEKSSGLVTVPTVTTSATPIPTETVSTVDSDQVIESSIKNIYVGDIKNPTGTARDFSVSTPVIYTHVDLIPSDQEVPGQVTATLVDVTTGSKLGPVGVDITTSGPQGADFSFTKPTKGWPKGDQKIVIDFGKSSRVYIFSVK